MRLLVFGSRKYPTSGRRVLLRTLNQIWREQRELGDMEMHIVAGHSVEKGKPVGPDFWAETWAIVSAPMGVTKTIISIKDIGGWDAFPGKSAGYHRNLRLAEQNLTHALDFWDGKSSGTRQMRDILREKYPDVKRMTVTPDMTDFTIKWE